MRAIRIRDGVQLMPDKVRMITAELCRFFVCGNQAKRWSPLRKRTPFVLEIEKSCAPILSAAISHMRFHLSRQRGQNRRRMSPAADARGCPLCRLRQIRQIAARYADPAN